METCQFSLDLVPIFDQVVYQIALQNNRPSGGTFYIQTYNIARHQTQNKTYFLLY